MPTKFYRSGLSEALEYAICSIQTPGTDNHDLSRSTVRTTMVIWSSIKRLSWVLTSHTIGSFRWPSPVGQQVNNVNGGPGRNTAMSNWLLHFQVQGALIVSSIFEIVVSLTGISGLLLRFIGPLVVAPCITLIGLSLVRVTIHYASGHWGITAM